MINTERPHWNHYFCILIRRTTWVRWGYAAPGERPKPTHVEAACITFREPFRWSLRFKLSDGWEADGVKYTPKVHSIVKGWAWTWWTESHGSSGGWRFCGRSKRRCLRKAFLSIQDRNQKIIPDGILDSTRYPWKELPMPEDWRKLAADQLKRVENWSAGKGYVLRPRKVKT
jgi:hypothetical protein